MTVHIFTREPFPIGFAATNRIIHYAKGLLKAGMHCEVVVITRTERGDIVNKCAEGVFEGIKYKYISGQTEREPIFSQRRIGDLSDYVRALKYLSKTISTGDAVLWYVGEVSMLYTSLVQSICRCRGVKLVRELCEMPYAPGVESRCKSFKRWVYSKFIMPRFRGFIAISEELSLYAHRVAKRSSQIKVPILVDVNQYEGVERYLHCRPYIFHAGTMTERKDAIISTMKAFVKASARVPKSVDYILAGPKSPHEDELLTLIRNNNLEDNVHFIGRISHKEVLAYQKGAFLSILNKHDNLQNRCGFSTKLGDVLLAGVPVVTTTVGEANFFLKDGISAYICEPHNVDAIADKIEEAVVNEPKRVEIGLAGREIAKENFDCKVHGVRLRKFFEGL